MRDDIEKLQAALREVRAALCDAFAPLDPILRAGARWRLPELMLVGVFAASLVAYVCGEGVYGLALALFGSYFLVLGWLLRS